MNVTAEILKSKIESLTPELAKAFIKIIDSMDTSQEYTVPQFQLDEVFQRIQFHSENTKTKLDFFESITELEQICA